ncbi:MAG: PDZ domain-containing protein [Chloroflexota bacterium]
MAKKKPVSKKTIKLAERQLVGGNLRLAQAGYVFVLILVVTLAVLGGPVIFDRSGRGSIGASFVNNPDGVIILVPSVGMEAEQAGIQAGDQLWAINGVPLPPGTTVEDAVNALRGDKGDVVSLTVGTAEGAPKTVEISLSSVYLDALAEKGMTLQGNVTYYLVMDILVLAVVIALSLWIFLKYRSDWLMLMVATLVLTIPDWTNSLTITFLGADQYSLTAGHALVRSLGLFLGGVVLFVFPNGKFNPPWTIWATALLGLYAVFSWVDGFSTGIRLPYCLDLWIGLGFYLLGIYAQVRRALQTASLAKRAPSRWLLYGSGTVCLFYILGLVYLLLPPNTFSLADGIVADMVKTGIFAAGIAFAATSLMEATRRVK